MIGSLSNWMNQVDKQPPVTCVWQQRFNTIWRGLTWLLIPTQQNLMLLYGSVWPSEPVNWFFAMFRLVNRVSSIDSVTFRGPACFCDGIICNNILKINTWYFWGVNYIGICMNKYPLQIVCYVPCLWNYIAWFHWQKQIYLRSMQTIFIFKLFYKGKQKINELVLQVHCGLHSVFRNQGTK